MTAMRGATTLIRVSILMLGLSACAAPPRGEPLAHLTFADRAPLGLTVAAIETRSTAASSDLAARLPVAPADAMRQWAHDRLRARGQAGAARFTVLTAAVNAQKEPGAKGLARALSDPPGSRCTITVEGRLDVTAQGGDGGVASAKVSRTQTMAGGMSGDERRRFWYALASDTMDAFDAQMERAIRQHLNPWVL